MADLRHVRTQELEAELKRRGREPLPSRCWKCGRWPVTVSCYSTYTAKPHCVGCMKTVDKCTC